MSRCVPLPGLTQLSECDGASGLDGDAPEHETARLVDGGADVVDGRVVVAEGVAGRPGGVRGVR